MSNAIQLELFQESFEVAGFQNLLEALTRIGGKPVLLGDTPNVTMGVELKFRQKDLDGSERKVLGKASIGMARWQIKVDFLTNHHGLAANSIFVNGEDRYVESLHWAPLPIPLMKKP